MDRKEILELIKDELSIEISIDEDWDSSDLKVKLYMSNEVIDESSVSIKSIIRSL